MIHANDDLETSAASSRTRATDTTGDTGTPRRLAREFVAERCSWMTTLISYSYCARR
jgi:hypothetical protein